MRIAIHSKQFSNEQNIFFNNLFELAKKENVELFVSEKSGMQSFFNIDDSRIFNDFEDLVKIKPNFLISIGGDGTFLDTLLLVKDSGIPVLGINLGRLGFLSNYQQNELSTLFEFLKSKNYKIESRSVIQLHSSKKIFGEDNFALNDFTIHKRDNSSLTTITTYLNGEFFNTYWGDGIIIATPTGSTAYSLSCGGPIIFPSSKNLVITPVAPHNLNVRPVILPEDVEISFEIKGREENFIVSLDSRYKIVDQSFKIIVRKAPFMLNTVSFSNQSFCKIISEKLMWGIDKRNF